MNKITYVDTVPVPLFVYEFVVLCLKKIKKLQYGTGTGTRIYDAIYTPNDFVTIIRIIKTKEVDFENVAVNRFRQHR